VIFLVISQKAIPKKDFRLRDLPGHGRIDIIFRCILAARRSLPSSEAAEIYCFLKGGESTGWISWKSDTDLDKDDEVSLAGKIRRNWNKYFFVGTLDELLTQLDYKRIILLAEDGIDIAQKNICDFQDDIIVIGAQNEPSAYDIGILNPHFRISLGQEIMLASHAITLYRQLSAIAENTDITPGI
jgi:tRNA pseudouridine-54 N-methylase